MGNDYHTTMFYEQIDELIQWLGMQMQLHGASVLSAWHGC